MLQALLDIRHVAPELRCRPFVSTDSMDWLNEHPGMTVMREQGIVTGDAVNEAVADRMRVLAAPDLEVVALLSRGKLLYGVKEKEEGGQDEQVGSRDIPDNEFRVLLARRGQHWVSAVRVGDEITVDDVAIADTASIAALDESESHVLMLARASTASRARRRRSSSRTRTRTSSATSQSAASSSTRPANASSRRPLDSTRSAVGMRARVKSCGARISAAGTRAASRRGSAKTASRFIRTAPAA